MQKRVMSKEHIFSLVLLVLSAVIFSWIGQATSIETSTGYASLQATSVRGFTPEHNRAWVSASNRFSSTQASSPATYQSIGTIMQKTTNGYFVKLENRKIAFISTTQFFNVGQEVLVVYKTNNHGQIIPTRISKT